MPGLDELLTGFLWVALPVLLVLLVSRIVSDHRARRARQPTSVFTIIVLGLAFVADVLLVFGRPDDITARLPAPSAGVAASQVVIDYRDWLRDGDALSWPIDPGQYAVHLTASDDGATVTWVGAACAGAPRETRAFDTTCDVRAPAQLIVKNPCSLCVGASSSVALRVVRLGQ